MKNMLLLQENARAADLYRHWEDEEEENEAKKKAEKEKVRRACNLFGCKIAGFACQVDFRTSLWGPSVQSSCLPVYLFPLLRDGLGKGGGRVIRGGRRLNLCVNIVAPLECQTSMKRL